MKRTRLLLALTLTSATLASAPQVRADPASRSKDPGPSDLPAAWREPLTLAQPPLKPGQQGTADPAAHTATMVAQAAPESEEAPPDLSDGSPAEAETGAESPAEGEADAAALAREAQNPIANLISVPFQNNTNFGAGPSGDGTPNVLNIQPVIPVPLSEELLLVTRTIIPVVNQPASATGTNSAFGLGDINPQFYFVPVSKGRITWGVGPTFVIPSATDDVLGQGKWSAGPAAVVVVTTDRLVYGAVGNNVWSFAGDDDRRSVSQFLVQPFVNYNLPKGWYLVSSPIITANWNAPDGEERWTVPIGGGIGRVFAIGKQKVNATLQAYWNVVKPDAAGDWTLRAQFQFLFPR
ncbi:putative Neuromedin U [Cyanobium sp. PCC 7001]|uniref:hypothetical protein n=1 Tax=Cyanobium sp. PCC 7001 TaxID=180281 RepID=UPI0001804AF7|nr:hypothetical protein [Cyanobium sp. PCC 7001]EDY39781.1 putative Neuromedin U [Cyanobium sp. PCC 7001]